MWIQISGVQFSDGYCTLPTFVIIFRVKGGVGKGSSPKAGGAAKGGAGGTGGDENYSYDDEEEDYDDAAEEGSGKTIWFGLCHPYSGNAQSIFVGSWRRIR